MVCPKSADRMRTSLSSRGYRVTRAYCVTVVHRTAPGLVSNQCGKSVPPPAKLMRSGVLARMMTDPPRLLVERSGTKVRVALMVLCVVVYCQCNRLWGPRTSACATSARATITRATIIGREKADGDNRRWNNESRIRSNLRGARGGRPLVGRYRVHAGSDGLWRNSRAGDCRRALSRLACCR